MTNPPGHQSRPHRPSRARAPHGKGGAPGTAPWQGSPATAGPTSSGTATAATPGTATPGTATPASAMPGTAAAPAEPRHTGEGISALSAVLLEVLRCPLTRGRLFPLDDRHLMSDRPYREGVHPVYEVIEGIPHMLPIQGAPSPTQEPQAREAQTRGPAS